MTTAVLSRDALEERLSTFKAELDAAYAPSTAMHEIKQLNGFKRKAEADGSFGRMFNGPQWLDGVAIRDGVIQGAKLAATIVISSTFVTVDPDVSTTADRMELDTTSLRFYGTVSGTPNTKVVDIGPTGFELGSGASKITFVSSTGVLTVPAAVITSLTIASVGAGVIGGTYKSSSSTAHLELSTSGIKAFNSGGTNTIFLDGTTGDLTITGTFTIQSSTSGARTEIKNTGLKVYDSGGTSRAQLLNDGSGFVGSTSGLGSGAAVSWTTGGVTTINASQITTGSLAFGATGTVNSTGSVTGTIGNSGGTLNLGALTVAGALTLGSGGKIIDADGSFWDQTGITLISAGSYGDSLQWKVSGSLKGSVFADSTGMWFRGGSNVSTNPLMRLNSTTGYASLEVQNQSSYLLVESGVVTMMAVASSNIYFSIDNNGRAKASGNIFPGNQNTYYIGSNGSRLDLAGPVNFVNHTTAGSTANWSTWNAAESVTSSYITVQIAGTNRRIPFFADA